MKSRKRWLAFLLSLVLAAAVFAGCAPGEGSSGAAGSTSAPMPTVKLNVMSFNLYFKNQSNVAVKNAPEGKTADMRTYSRLPKLGAMLRGEGIDIAGFQEVGKDWYPLITELFPEEYSAFGQYANDNDQSTYGYGEAGLIVYNNQKFAVLESGYYYLAPNDPATPVKGWDADHYRIVNWAVFQEKQTGIIFLFNTTHLDNNGKQARLESAKLILEKTRARVESVKAAYGIENVPVILVGDFNATATSDEIKTLTGFFGDAKLSAKGATVAPELSSSPGLYYCASEADLVKNGHCIDFIFHTEEAVAVESFKMIHTATNLCAYGEWISDHNAIIAKLTLQN